MPTSEVTAPDGTVLEVTHPEGASQEEIIAYAKNNWSPKQEEQGVGETVARWTGGLGTEVAMGEGGKLGAAALGTLIAPGIGTAAGYVIGGLASGASGSIARQKIIDPDADIRWGEVVADSFINIIPFGKVGKAGKTAATAGRRALGAAGRSVGKGAVGGAAVGEAGLFVETAIDEQRLPTMDEIYSRGLTAAALGAGFGMAGEAFNKAYQKFAGMPSSALTDAYKAGDPDATLIIDGLQKNAQEHVQQQRKWFLDLYQKTREVADDELMKARQLQKQSGGGQYTNKNGVLEVVSDETDYYMQRRLAEGTIQNRNKRIADTIDLDADFLRLKSKELGRSQGELSDGIDSYLHAKHALTYNKKFGDGKAGMTNDEAADIIQGFEASDLHNQLGPSIKMRRDSANEILDILVEGGLVAPTLATSLRKQYPDYVPLNRIMTELDAEDQIIGNITSGSSKYEAFSSGLRRAKGSEREVRNITQNIYENLAGAIRRAEVNKANLAFKRLLESNEGQNVARIRKPKVVGKTKDAMGNDMPIWENAGDNVLTVFDMGERYFIEFNDPAVAKAFKGKNKSELDTLLKGGYAVNRFIGGLLTRWNPAFLAPNLVRDRVEATVNNMAKMGAKDAISTLNPVSDMITIERNLRKIPPRNQAERELDGLYQRFQDSGGSTGGLGLSTVQHIEDEVAKMAKNLRNPSNRTIKRANEIVNQINEVFEDATRFGTFRRGVRSGMTDSQAALAARDSSFDPLLKGTSGETLRALYMFSNPSIQGMKNFLRSMSKPKVAVPVMMTMMGMTMAIDRWNQRYDPNWREKLKTQDGSNWKVNKHLIIVHGQNKDGTLNYVSLPMGYSAVPFKVMADKSQMMMTGQVGTSGQDLAEIASEIGTEIIDSYNPMGGSPIPTPLRPIHELQTNKDGLGRAIRPEWLETKNMSATEKVYPWTAETYGGELAMSFAHTLDDMGMEVSPESLLYLHRFYTGGPGTFVNRLFNVTSKLWNGEKISPSEVPIARRFFGQTYAQAFERRNGEKQIIENIDKQENTEAAVASRKAYNYYRTYKDNGSGQQGLAAAYSKIRGEDEWSEAVLRRFHEKVEADLRGITYTDQELQNLGVKSGAMAEAYVKLLENMPPEQRRQYIMEQMQKGIMSEEVQRQLFIRKEMRKILQEEAPPNSSSGASSY